MHRSRLVAALALVLPTAAWAAQPKQSVTDLDQRAFFKPELYVSSAHAPLADIQSRLPNQAAWDAFLQARLSAGQEPVHVYIDPRSGAVTNLMGAFPIIPGSGAGNSVTLGSLAQALGRPVPAVDADRYRIGAGEAARLNERDPSDQSLFSGDKRAGKAALRELNKRLEELQELLYADNRHRLLVVLQATDTGGKDGTIRHVFRGVNPQGVRVHSFGVPSETELAHDYLWRIHAHVPPDGYIGVFNRSHYEDVLVVRVKDLAPEEVWSKRYQHIREFERVLSDEGTTIVQVTHSEENAAYGDRIVRLRDGWLVDE